MDEGRGLKLGYVDLVSDTACRYSYLVPTNRLEGVIMGTFVITALWRDASGDLMEQDNHTRAQTAQEAVAETVQGVVEVWDGEILAVLVNATQEQKDLLAEMFRPFVTCSR